MIKKNFPGEALFKILPDRHKKNWQRSKEKFMEHVCKGWNDSRMIGHLYSQRAQFVLKITKRSELIRIKWKVILRRE